MVNYLLMITAELENLTDLQPQGGCDDPNFSYYFKAQGHDKRHLHYACFWMIALPFYLAGEMPHSQLLLGKSAPLLTVTMLKCGNCGEVTQKETCVTLNETVPSAKGKGETNLSQKCKFCSREGTVSMITGRGRPLTQEQAEAGKYAPLMSFDCRGFEPVGFLFGSSWKAESLAGTKYNDIDLSGGEFAEYDEKGECPVMISNLRAKFDVVK
ncbi:UNVERIFIED_CONTAM: CXXC motif containing zinc binding protein [Sesamum radiatum]|uniref:CXXC motif containing zinc binding protein n=1 Tax=Sesamum radiatum TaxID=300843 RepID=A0AAW2JUQ5_SESRA